MADTIRLAKWILCAVTIFFGIVLAAEKSPKVNGEYILNTPGAELKWVLTEESGDARWMYNANTNDRRNLVDIDKRVQSGVWSEYLPGEVVQIRELDSECAKVIITVGSNTGKFGWVAADLLEPTPSERRRIDAARKQDAAKRAADERSKHAKQIKV